jgi:concentrative nucleoside transporter, CNT family
MDVVSLLRGLLGLAFILALAVALSSDRRAINWRTVGFGLALQLLFAVFVLKGDDMAEAFAPLGWPAAAFSFGASFFVVFLDWVEAGASFLFGNLALGPGNDGSLGFFFAFQVLPTIIVFSSLMSILYYLGVMQRVVRAMAWVVSRALGTSGPESLSVTANIFVGQTEAPLVIRPYIQGMSRSELLAVMTGGMATIAGGVMASYIQFLGGEFATARGVTLEAGQQLFAEQLLGASVMAAPAALLLAKILIPETRPVAPLHYGVVSADEGQAEMTADPVVPAVDSEEATREVASAEQETAPKNVIDAAAGGAADGLKLALNVGAMLIAFLALIAGINYVLDAGAGAFGYTTSLERILGVVLAPVAWMIGVPAADVTAFGSLLGQKVVANEFVAYLGLAEAIQSGALSPKGITMATFALCGFANFSSIAIQIGGIGPLAPSRTGEIAELGLRAVLAGTLANLMTATIAGVLLG